jgi:hypothetical protein
VGEAGDVCALGLVCSIPALGSVGLPLLAEGGSQVVISWCTWPTSVGKSKNM